MAAPRDDYLAQKTAAMNLTVSHLDVQKAAYLAGKMGLQRWTVGCFLPKLAEMMVDHLEMRY